MSDQEEEWVSAAEALAMLKPTLTDYAARHRICERAHVGLVRARAEQFNFGKQVFHDHNIPMRFWWAKGHEALEQDWTAGDFSTWIDNSVEMKAFGVKFARTDIAKILPTPNVKTETTALSAEHEELISKLNDLVPSAALSYKQALLDIADETRVSFRGPALELREALRDIVDHLAPDAGVIAEPGYLQEKNTKGPTTRQKVRFIMKKKAQNPSSEVAEGAVATFDEAFAGLTRAVSQRSSKAAHGGSERNEVLRLRHHIAIIFHEILGT